MENKQKPLDLANKKDIIVLDETTISNQPDTLAAFNLMPHAYGLTDQVICADLPMDKAQWSKCCSGTAHFPMLKLPRLFDICGSEAYLQRLLYERGYEAIPQKRKSQLERELEAAEKRADTAEMERDILVNAINGRSIS